MPVVTHATLRAKAEKLQEAMLSDQSLALSSSAYAALSSMRFSGGWLEKFLRRHRLKSRKTHGEAASVSNSAVEEGRRSLQSVVSAFAKCDVFNLDETAYFYCMAPSTTISQKPFAGRKQVKKRMTVAVANNADGSVKLPLFFVGTAARPRCFGGQSATELGFDYANSAKGWMTSSVFGAWLKRFDEQMRNDGRHVLLLLDNVSSHKVVEGLTNVSIHMLPPNTTSHLQPQDAGIIQAFKKAIDKVRRRYIVDRFDEMLTFNVHNKEDIERDFDSLYVVDVLTAMTWAKQAWAAVTSTTIAHCWQHTGIVDDEIYELVAEVEKLAL